MRNSNNAKCYSFMHRYRECVLGVRHDKSKIWTYSDTDTLFMCSIYNGELQSFVTNFRSRLFQILH